MKNTCANINDSKEAILGYLKCMDLESKSTSDFMKEEELKNELDALFKRAYPFPLEKLSEIQRTRIFRRWTRGPLNYVTRQIVNNPEKLRVLDAGCGWGIHSIYFSTLGCNVVGVDLREKRIQIARKRLAYYQDKNLLNGDVLFQNKNIFSLNYEQEFDIIWAIEAISHISPAMKFLEHSYKMLKPGGQIIIGDHNGMHLIEQIRLLKKRGTTLYTKKIDPETGEYVEYAIERVFSIRTITGMLREANLEVVHKEARIGFNSRSNDFLFSKIIRPLQSAPILTDILGSYYVIAGKRV